jgi:hypothetical protein
MKSRDSIRKVLALYEHELNLCIERALHGVARLSMSAQTGGYFTFGCVAAFPRLDKTGEIIAREHSVALFQSYTRVSSPRHKLGFGTKFRALLVKS